MYVFNPATVGSSGDESNLIPIRFTIGGLVAIIYSIFAWALTIGGAIVLYWLYWMLRKAGK